MKKILQKIPYLLFIALSILTLLQIAIIFKDSYSTNNAVEFNSNKPKPANLQPSLLEENSTLININTASAQEIDKLPGIGSTFTKKIIESRPYLSKDELISKAGLSQKVFDEIKELISL